MSGLYGMDENIGQTDSIQSAFSNRVQAIGDKNQDVLSKWQDKQETKIEFDQAKQYGDQGVGIGETLEQVAGGAYEAKQYLDAKRQKVGDVVETENRKRRNRKRKTRRDNGEVGVSEDEDESPIERDSNGEIKKKQEDITKTNDERTDDTENEGDGQHNTGGSPESPEEVATDTHEGEGSGGRPDEPPAVPEEAPTNNGSNVPDPEPEPSPSPPEPEPTPTPDEPATIVEPKPIEATEPLDEVKEPDDYDPAFGGLGEEDEASRSGMFGEGSSKLRPNRSLQNKAISLYGGEEQDFSKFSRNDRFGFGLDKSPISDYSNADIQEGVLKPYGGQTAKGVESEFTPIEARAQNLDAISEARIGRVPQTTTARTRLNSLYGDDDAIDTHIAKNSAPVSQQIESVEPSVEPSGEGVSSDISGASETSLADLSPIGESGASEIGERASSAIGNLGEQANTIASRGTSLLSRGADALDSLSSGVGQVSDIGSSIASGDISGATQKASKAISSVGKSAGEAGSEVEGFGQQISQKAGSVATSLASNALRYGADLASVASAGQNIYGEIKAGGKEGDDTVQRVANWGSTISSGMEAIGAGLDLTGVGAEVGAVLNIGGAVIGGISSAVDDVDKWFEDKKKKANDQNQLKTQGIKGLAGTQSNPTYQNIGASGGTANISQSAIRAF